ncbi:MAG: alpha/beta hydrolase [Sphingomonas sp.]|nr:alpha/beta hydrolase [Sphingomonas sp.]
MGVAAAASPASAQNRAKVFAPTPPWPPREHFMLWPGLPPGSPPGLVPASEPVPLPLGTPQRWEKGIRHPYVGVYRPQQPDGRAVLAIPGGGYVFVSLINEGVNVARALNPHGITVFVLAYRLPGEGWLERTDVPLQDAQRAMRLIRANAAHYRIDPAKLGICGFSAGGNLGAALTVGHEDAVYRPVDVADRLSARPSFTGLAYPVTSFASAGPTSRSGPNLLGADPPAGAAERYDMLARASAAMPPLFLIHAMDDGTVPVTQSLSAIEVARRFKVPVEAHLLERGGHGFGAASLKPANPGSTWLDWFEKWTAMHMR